LWRLILPISVMFGEFLRLINFRHDKTQNSVFVNYFDKGFISRKD
jgi:hypothetical protein